MGRAVFQLQAGMLKQLLEHLQHPFQFQGHGFGQRCGWIKRSRDRPLAMPLCTDLLGTAWIAAHGLLPQGAVNAKARTMQDSHGSQC
jgi:hypothetical protein